MRPPCCYRCNSYRHNHQSYLLACARCLRTVHHSCDDPPTIDAELRYMIRCDDLGKGGGTDDWTCGSCRGRLSQALGRRWSDTTAVARAQGVNGQGTTEWSCRERDGGEEYMSRTSFPEELWRQAGPSRPASTAPTKVFVPRVSNLESHSYTSSLFDRLPIPSTVPSGHHQPDPAPSKPLAPQPCAPPPTFVSSPTYRPSRPFTSPAQPTVANDVHRYPSVASPREPGQAGMNGPFLLHPSPTQHPVMSLSPDHRMVAQSHPPPTTTRPLGSVPQLFPAHGLMRVPTYADDERLEQAVDKPFSPRLLGHPAVSLPRMVGAPTYAPPHSPVSQAPANRENLQTPPRTPETFYPDGWPPPWRPSVEPFSPAANQEHLLMSQSPSQASPGATTSPAESRMSSSSLSSPDRLPISPAPPPAPPLVARSAPAGGVLRSPPNDVAPPLSPVRSAPPKAATIRLSARSQQYLQHASSSSRFSSPSLSSSRSLSPSKGATDPNGIHHQSLEDATRHVNEAVRGDRGRGGGLKLILKPPSPHAPAPPATDGDVAGTGTDGVQTQDSPTTPSHTFSQAATTPSPSCHPETPVISLVDVAPGTASAMATNANSKVGVITGTRKLLPGRKRSASSYSTFAIPSADPTTSGVPVPERQQLSLTRVKKRREEEEISGANLALRRVVASRQQQLHQHQWEQSQHQLQQHGQSQQQNPRRSEKQKQRAESDMEVDTNSGEGDGEGEFGSSRGVDGGTAYYPKVPQVGGASSNRSGRLGTPFQHHFTGQDEAPAPAPSSSSHFHPPLSPVVTTLGTSLDSSTDSADSSEEQDEYSIRYVLRGFTDKELEKELARRRGRKRKLAIPSAHADGPSVASSSRSVSPSTDRNEEGAVERELVGDEDLEKGPWLDGKLLARAVAVLRSADEAGLGPQRQSAKQGGGEEGPGAGRSWWDLRPPSPSFQPPPLDPSAPLLDMRWYRPGPSAGPLDALRAGWPSWVFAALGTIRLGDVVGLRGEGWKGGVDFLQEAGVGVRKGLEMIVCGGGGGGGGGGGRGRTSLVWQGQAREAEKNGRRGWAGMKESVASRIKKTSPSVTHAHAFGGAGGLPSKGRPAKGAANGRGSPPTLSTTTYVLKVSRKGARAH